MIVLISFVFSKVWLNLKNSNEPGAPDFSVRYGMTKRGLRPIRGNWRKDITRSRFDVAGLFDPSTAQSYIGANAFFGELKPKLVNNIINIDFDGWAYYLAFRQ